MRKVIRILSIVLGLILIKDMTHGVMLGEFAVNGIIFKKISILKLAIVFRNGIYCMRIDE